MCCVEYCTFGPGRKCTERLILVHVLPLEKEYDHAEISFWPICAIGSGRECTKRVIVINPAFTTGRGLCQKYFGSISASGAGRKMFPKDDYAEFVSL